MRESKALRFFLLLPIFDGCQFWLMNSRRPAFAINKDHLLIDYLGLGWFRLPMILLDWIPGILCPLPTCL